MNRLARGQELKGHLDLLLLSVVAAAGPLHGYAVIDRLRSQGGDILDIPEGTAYPALHRLEELGYLSSRWSEVAGRKRRTYAITRKGRTVLDEKQQSWSVFSQAVNRVLQNEPWPSPT